MKSHNIKQKCMNYPYLNLARREYSDIPYHIDSYPDGEKHLVIEGHDWNKNKYINVITRIASMDDLFILIQAYNILYHEDVKICNLLLTYVLGARCDRRFSLGEAIDANIIQNLIVTKVDAKHIYTLDYHSSLNYVPDWKDLKVFPKEINPNTYLLVYPDKGAYDRFKSIESMSPFCIGSKVRDDSGIRIELDKPHYKDRIDSEIMVVDDLCDAGGTFIVLADVLKQRFPNKKKNIFITHAIQKIGIERIAEHYENVYITNSYKDWDKEELPSNVTVVDVLKNSCIYKYI